MDKRYARLKRKMLLLVVAGTLAALAVGMLLLHTVVDGVLQDPFARAFLWVAQNLFGQDEAAALELYQQTVRNQKPGLLALGTIVLMLVAFYLALGRFTTWLDQIGAAVRQVVSESGQPVVLPKELAPVAEDLNAIERALKEREETARESEQRRGDLVAFLAHDLKTPLTSVLGYLNLLHDEPGLTPEQRAKYTGIALDKARRLEELISEFFDITRMDLQGAGQERCVIHLSILLEQLADEFYPLFAEKGLTCRTDITPQLTTRGDPDKLARVFDNVLRNAVAYADANSVIAIAARQDARTTTITVANRGREISDAHLETIFEKFYREDGARSSKKGGAGLGLAIAREIVVAHHGDIEAASERGVTVFTLRIPTQGEEIEGAAAAPRIPGATEGVQRPVEPVPPRTVRPASTRATSAPPSATARRGPSARPIPQRPVGERTQAPRQGTSPLNPRNARHGQVPARKTVRDNDATPRRRGLSR